MFRVEEIFCNIISPGTNITVFVSHRINGEEYLMILWHSL